MGDVLVLYSDGIVERPGRTPAQSTVELAQVAADVSAGRALRSTGMSKSSRNRALSERMKLCDRSEIAPESKA